MANQAGFEKAYLKIEQGEKIECYFNPKEYTLARTNKWDVKPVPGAPLPNAQFSGSDPHKLNIDLLFDDSESPSGGDVRPIAQKLLNMMEVDPKFGTGEENNSRPPMVEFGWGGVLTFNAVCDSLSIQYTLFRPDGAPIRASVKLGLTQVKEATVKPAGKTTRTNPPTTNPTTTAIPGLRSYTVRDGDSLQSIAYASYGDATKWRVIADANDIDNPVRLRRGTLLAIPRLVE